MSFVQAKPAATYDFYAAIHKGLRFALSNLLVRIGQTDPTDVASRFDVIAAVRHQCLLSAGHLANEEAEIHIALEERAPGVSQGLEASHHEHRRSFVDIEALLQRAEAADANDTRQAWRALYLRFSQFAGEDFAHMAEEELEILPILQALFTDAELMAMEGRIMAAMSPDSLMDDVRLIAPATTRAERAALMGAFRLAAPAEAFDAVMALAVQPSLPAAAWDDLRADLGLAA